MKIYVNQIAKLNGDGSKERPFTTIQQAADIALPGDEVILNTNLDLPLILVKKEKKIYG